MSLEEEQVEKGRQKTLNTSMMAEELRGLKSQGAYDFRELQGAAGEVSPYYERRSRDKASRIAEENAAERAARLLKEALDEQRRQERAERGQSEVGVVRDAVETILSDPSTTEVEKDVLLDQKAYISATR
jgi:hypothetical protein